MPSFVLNATNFRFAGDLGSAGAKRVSSLRGAVNYRCWRRYPSLPKLSREAAFQPRFFVRALSQEGGVDAALSLFPAIRLIDESLAQQGLFHWLGYQLASKTFTRADGVKFENYDFSVPSHGHLNELLRLIGDPGIQFDERDHASDGDEMAIDSFIKEARIAVPRKVPDSILFHANLAAVGWLFIAPDAICEGRDIAAEARFNGETGSAGEQRLSSMKLGAELMGIAVMFDDRIDADRTARLRASALGRFFTADGDDNPISLGALHDLFGPRRVKTWLEQTSERVAATQELAIDALRSVLGNRPSVGADL